MGWKLKCAVVTALAALCVVFVAAVAAALDEFARLPFYHTATAAALLSCVGSLVVLLRARRRPAELGHLLGGLTRPAQLWPRARGTRGGVTRPEVESALRKIHSVAWDFPARARAVGPLKEEECINYESRR